MATRTSGQPTKLAEPALRKLLKTYLSPESLVPGQPKPSNQMATLLREVGSQSGAGVFRTAEDALGELSKWCYDDRTRITALLDAPDGKLRKYLRQAIVRAARDAGAEQGDPGTKLQKALNAVLLKARRATPPTIEKRSGGRVRLTVDDAGSGLVWPEHLRDGDDFSHPRLEAAAFAALAVAPARTLTVRDLRAAIDEHYGLKPKYVSNDRGQEANSVPMVGQPRIGVEHDARSYARQIYDVLTPQERDTVLALGEGRYEAGPEGYVAAARSLRCDEATVRRRVSSIRVKVDKIVQNTSSDSLNFYFRALLEEIRERA